MKKRILLYLSMVLYSGSSIAQNWSNTGTPFHFGHSYNDIVEFNAEMYTVGYLYNGISGSPDAYTPAVHRNTGGNTWVQLGSGFSSSQYAESYNIHAIVEFDAELYIGGDFVMDNGVDAVFYDVAKWDDSNDRWVPAGDGTSSGSIKELTVFDGKLYAGGAFSDLGLAGTNNIAVWDGVSWGPVGTGTSVDDNGTEEDDQVVVMTVFDNELFVGGKFTQAGGELVHNIASWDGANWNYLNGTEIEGHGGVGGSNSGQVYIQSLQEFDGDLYIGGTFTVYYNSTFIGSSTGVPNHLVVWSGSSFSAPIEATPTNVKVNAMNVFDGRIYIGNSSESNIYSWDASIFNWRLEPDRDPARQRPNCFYSNATNIYYGDKYGVFRFLDPLPAFSTSNTTPCPSEEVTFTDLSTGTNTITGWNWTFEGGTPATSIDQNPVVTFAANGTYDVTLEVTSADGVESLTFEDHITVDDVITLNSDPASVITCANVAASYSISTSTGGDITYQWQVNEGTGFVDLIDGGDNNVSGATSATLNYTPTVDNDGYVFRCVLSRCATSVNSAEAPMTVNEAPEITDQPITQAVCANGNASYTIAVESGSALAYEWQYRTGSIYTALSDGGKYSGVNTATLTLTDVDNTLAELFDSDNGDGITYANFRCVVTANSCSVTSNIVNLNIHDAPTITGSPADLTICDTGSGASTSFSVISSITVNNMHYQWQVDEGEGFVDLADDEVYSDTNSATLSLTAATSTLSGNQYRCEVGACASPVYSSAATLTIDEISVITESTSGTVNICDGSDTLFSITATGENISYQWQTLEGSNYVDLTDNDTYFGSGSAELQISEAGLSLNNRRYRCVLTNGACSRNSNQITLRVHGVPNISGAPANRTTCEGAGPISFNRPSVSGFFAAVHSYQWQEALAGTDVFIDLENGDLYSGATGTVLYVTPQSSSMSGNRYRLKINGCITEVVSDPATLTIKQLPIISASPEPQTVCTGEASTFSVAAIGGEDIIYQWQTSSDGGENWNSGISGYSGTMTSTITSNNTQFSLNGYLIRCVVTAATPCSGILSTESLGALLTVYENVSISEQPINLVEICNGENTSLSVAAQGESLTYQWVDASNSDTPITDGGVYSGATTPSLTITEITTEASNGYFLNNYYRCVITGTCNEVTSGVSQLFVNGGGKAEIQINTGVPEVLFALGGPSSTSGSITFDWFLDGEFFTSGSSQLSIDQQGSYTVVISAAGCPGEESEPYVYVITDVTDEFEDDISIYPSPALDVLQVDMNGAVEADIRLLSLEGKLAKDFGNHTGKKIELSVNDLPSGIYFLHIQNQKGNRLQKILIK